MRFLPRAAWALLLPAACSGTPEQPPEPELSFVVVTFNTGTTSGLRHEGPPDDGYTSQDAVTSDTYYGNGLAWRPAIEATRRFLQQVRPDVVVFQEIFHPGGCPDIPPEAYPGFVCETWSMGDRSVAQSVLGDGYQVACNLGKPDKCAGVARRFGVFRGCDSDLCLDGLDGGLVPGCGGGSRVGRAVIDLVEGGSITLATVHGSSGTSAADAACRVAQFEQVFVDLGDGAPAASGRVNVVMGDLNTDPVILEDADPSAKRFLDFVGEGKRFHFVTDIGRRVPSSYAGILNIDHVVSDAFDGSCWIAGLTEGHPAVTDAVYFDHKPAVCTLGGDRP